ncbi:hypothetical protein AM272_05460 [Escherichia coli]|uniref:hypothetical protein n=1 Tax=Escherichia coli TaxID=562 RepID=UPI000707DCBD|nr:hypothetical protein [Escherichia coli]KQJ43149.1 hypothetical protein AM272_05460 [Escherichia coli]
MIELLILAVVLLYIAGAILMACFITSNDLDRGGLIPFWPIAVFIALVDATRTQIKRAIKERKNEK